MADGPDRTEQPTPKRREDARKKGKVVLSPEVSPVAVLLAALALAWFGAPSVLGQGRVLMAGWLAAVGPAAAYDDSAWPAIAAALVQMATVLAPLFVATALVGAGAVVAQVGWEMRPHLLAPDPERISLAKGMKRLFSANGAMNLIKAVTKIVVVGLVAYRVLWRTGTEAIAAPGMTVAEIIAFAGQGLGRLLATMAMALAVLGVLDYLWQRWRSEQSLRMTRQEVKD